MTNKELIEFMKRYGAWQIHSEAIAFYRILEKLKATTGLKTIVELGIDRGGTLKLWSSLLKPGDLIAGVDITLERFRQDLTKMECDCKLVTGDSQQLNTLNMVKNTLGQRQVDFLFIDANHGRGVFTDYKLYSPLVRKGGIIAFHDITPIASPRELFESLPEQQYKFEGKDFGGERSVGIGYIFKGSIT